MNKSIYLALNNRIPNKHITKIIYPIVYILLRVIYFIKKNTIKEIVNINVQEAYLRINNIQPKPDGKHSYKERIINNCIDLSIIIPAYNVEKYIGDCINSVLAQSTKYRYEVIIVNDGSTDRTSFILKKYIDNKNIRIINQSNKGFSGARNEGIDNSSGRYIMFLDSDDILVDNAIETMLNIAYEKNASIVQGAHYDFDESGKRNYYNLVNAEIDNGNFDKIVAYSGYPWGKIYEAKIFEKIRFPLNFWYEDTIVKYIFYRLCGKFVVISNVVYGYRINPVGITCTSTKSLKCIDSYWIVEEMLDLLKKNNLEVNGTIYKLTLMQLSKILYVRIKSLNEEIIKNIFILACDLIQSIKLEKKELNTIYLDIEKAFQTRNYKLWKLSSRYLWYLE